MHWWTWAIGLGWLFGCGTALYVTPVPLKPEGLAQLRRGGERMQCREQRSEEFALFLICPGRKQTIGFSAIKGQQALTCMDMLWPRNCKRLAKRLRTAGQQPAAKQVPDAAR
jgi:hypothetical protein